MRDCQKLRRRTEKTGIRFCEEEGAAIRPWLDTETLLFFVCLLEIGTVANGPAAVKSLRDNILRQLVNIPAMPRARRSLHRGEAAVERVRLHDRRGARHLPAVGCAVGDRRL